MQSDMASYLVRSLLSEGRIRYEYVDKTEQGMKPKRIEREGPTGLIVTTTRTRLHPENETRLLSLTVTDTPEQTRHILRATAAPGRTRKADLSQWHAIQLAVESSPKEVDIPYQGALAELVEAPAVRMRRDFPATLHLIAAHALLHQATRRKDDRGRIVATLEDYAPVRELVADLIAEGTEAAVPPAVRETVEAVRELLREEGDGATVTIKNLAAKLGIDKSAASRRWQNARDRDLLRNQETSKGRAARLVLGDPLPEDVEILPSVDRLREAFEDADHAHAEKANLSPAPCLRLDGCTVDRETGKVHPPPPSPSESREVMEL